MKKLFLIGLTFIIIIQLFSACKKANPDTGLIGRWELNSAAVISNGQLAYSYKYKKDSSYIYKFNSDNTYNLKYLNDTIENGTYSIDSNKLYRHSLVNNIEKYGTVNFIIANPILTLSDSGHDASGNYTETQIYTRLGAK